MIIADGNLPIFMTEAIAMTDRAALNQTHQTGIDNMIEYYHDINCANGYGCPEWAWRQYLEYKENHPEEYSERWKLCGEGLPIDQQKKLVLTQSGYVLEAVYISRIAKWVTVWGEVVIEVTHWRDKLPLPDEEFEMSGFD